MGRHHTKVNLSSTVPDQESRSEIQFEADGTASNLSDINTSTITHQDSPESVPARKREDATSPTIDNEQNDKTSSLAHPDGNQKIETTNEAGETDKAPSLDIAPPISNLRGGGEDTTRSPNAAPTVHMDIAAIMSSSQGMDPKDVPMHVIKDKPLSKNVTELVSNRSTIPLKTTTKVTTKTPKQTKFSKIIESTKASGKKLFKPGKKKKEDIHPKTQINMLETRTYSVSSHLRTSKRGALVDRGANGGVAGSVTRIIGQTGRTVVITGIDDHQLDNIPVGTCGAVVSMVCQDRMLVQGVIVLPPVVARGETDRRI